MRIEDISCPLHLLYYTFMVRLLDAYKAQESVKDRELLLSTLKCGKNQRYVVQWNLDLTKSSI